MDDGRAAMSRVGCERAPLTVERAGNQSDSTNRPYVLSTPTRPFALDRQWTREVELNESEMDTPRPRCAFIARRRILASRVCPTHRRLAFGAGRSLTPTNTAVARRRRPAMRGTPVARRLVRRSIDGLPTDSMTLDGKRQLERRREVASRSPREPTPVVGAAATMARETKRPSQRDRFEPGGQQQQQQSKGAKQSVNWRRPLDCSWCGPKQAVRDHGRSKEPRAPSKERLECRHEMNHGTDSRALMAETIVVAQKSRTNRRQQRGRDADVSPPFTDDI
uniref:Uncharacterized protein n=1 Tax=Plectus sambesii TaxID=2011161 RepID=A0A914V555_9BILA